MNNYKSFKDYYQDIISSVEVFGRYSAQEVYDRCATRWLARHPEMAIPSIRDLSC